MPDNIHNAAEASRQLGAADVTPRPTLAPNATNTNDKAVAAKAPSRMGDHCKYRGPRSARSASESARGVEMLSIDISIILAQRRPKKDSTARITTTNPTR